MEYTIVMNSNNFDYIRRLQSYASAMIPVGHVLVPLEPIEDMIIQGLKSEPVESFSDENKVRREEC
jgi:hypothetical protein